jgi:hypothetical protein
LQGVGASSAREWARYETAYLKAMRPECRLVSVKVRIPRGESNCAGDDSRGNRPMWLIWFRLTGRGRLRKVAIPLPSPEWWTSIRRTASSLRRAVRPA